MSRWILVVAIILVLSLVGLFLLALFLWWFMRRRDEERQAPAAARRRWAAVSPGRPDVSRVPERAAARIELPPEALRVPEAETDVLVPEAGVPPAAADLELEAAEVDLVEPETDVPLPDVDLPALDVEAPEPETVAADLERFQEAGGSATPDDLKRIEGIGPKISRVLQKAGIQTFAALAGAEISRLEQILEAADPRLLRLADPTTWPEQAGLAAADDWEGLQRLQEAFRGGRRRD